MDLATLPQKAGCQPADLHKVVLKKLVDNGLDSGGTVTLNCEDGVWVISDDGPGIKPADVTRLFSVNRPLMSSKLKRLPFCGMLGNGLRVVVGAVAATGGSLTVETCGRRLTLAVSHQTGKTTTVLDELIPPRPGMTVRLSIGFSNDDDGVLARGAIAIARCGKLYTGPSSPWWYGAKDLQRLFTQVTPATTSVGTLCASLGLQLDDARCAPTLDRQETEEVLLRLRANSKPVPFEDLGFIGKEFRSAWPGYARKGGLFLTQAGAQIPFVVESWTSCARPQRKGQGDVDITLMIMVASVNMVEIAV